MGDYSKRSCRMDHKTPRDGGLHGADFRGGGPLSDVKLRTSVMGDSDSHCSRDSHCSGRQRPPSVTEGLCPPLQIFFSVRAARGERVGGWAGVSVTRIAACVIDCSIRGKLLRRTSSTISRGYCDRLSRNLPSRDHCPVGLHVIRERRTIAVSSWSPHVVAIVWYIRCSRRKRTVVI